MDVLTDKGWQMFYTCTTCRTNGPVEHWSNPKHVDYEVRVMTKKKAFTLVLKNMQIYGPDWLYKLEDSLKKFKIDG